MSGPKLTACALCAGTGSLILNNSWFRGDTRRERCSICKGTGHSNYRPDAGLVSEQKRARAALSEVAP